MFQGVTLEDKKPAVHVKQATSFSIKCFGEFEVRNSKGHSIHWPTRKTEELFALFLCYPQQEVTRQTLVEKLWSDIDEDRAVYLLHHTLHRLKLMLVEHELGFDVLESRHGYRLESREDGYDVQEFAQFDFTQLEKEIELERAEQACSLYRGRLFENKNYLWKVPLEEEYHYLYTHLIRVLIRNQMARREWSKAERWVLSFLFKDPFHEEMNVTLLLIYAHMGDTEKMAKHFSWFEAVLLEMGMVPPTSIKRWVTSYLA